MSNDAVETQGGTIRESELAEVQVQVVRGAPDDLELAALVAGLVAAAGDAQDDGPAASHDAWTDRARAMRTRSAPGTPLRPGLDAWRWSLRG